MSEFRVVGTGVDRRVAQDESLVILAGIQGPAGNSFGFRWRGTWDSGTQYQEDDAVYNAVDSKTYICVVGASIASQPPSADWDVMVADGAQAVSDHVALADPHTQYQQESEKAQANGYASLDANGDVPDAQIPDAITRDSELSAAQSTLQGNIDAHVNDASAAHAASAIGFTPTGTIAATDAQAAIAEVASEATTAMSDHVAASDPHTGYQKESEKDAASGYCGLDSNARVAEARLGTGTGSATKALYGDQTWQSVNRVLRFGGGFDSPTSAKNPIVARCPVAGTVTAVYAAVTGGTNVVFNAQVNANDLRSADLTVTPAAGWTDFGTLQNTTVAAGDYLKIEIVSISGTPTWAAVQIEVTPT